ncbi:hypothetical protein AVEN_56587-1 [Araneus ventricosus]|uniref:Uncharacterized protein n=1 Tax=Araneus ventricosus TaxID=182803 RepID=A0A4Y2SCL8_ARAVE|nr:hypothetical protein AVEN_263417-1 [Araneus ventricosus]GBN85515.1 hypothetical protein AVEN_251595-1 [Araneus ventricosus]GBN85563.1 hypothetical protein AVEN_56587-1 [Araneus ventricosus]
MILTDFLPQFYQRRVCKYAGRRVPGSKPNPLKIRRVWGLLNVKSDVVAKRPPACTVPRTHSAPACPTRLNAYNRTEELVWCKNTHTGQAHPRRV